MNWTDKINNLVHRSRDIIVAPQYMEDNKGDKATITSPEWVTNPQFGSPRRINFTELEDYEDDVTVQAAVNFIIDSIATAEWDILTDEDANEEGLTDDVDNAEVVKFFEGKDWQDSFDVVLRGLIADTLLYDSGVLVLTFPEHCYDANKELTKEGVPPLQIRARDGRSFIKQVDVYGNIIKYWQYSFLRMATTPIEFSKDEVIYVQERPSTRSPYGTAKLEIVKNITDLMIATQVGHRAEQENAMQIGGVISHADVADAEKLKRLSELYNSNLKGEHNKKRWLVTGGNVEVKPVNANAVDDTWIPGAEWYQQQILSIFKVPRTILGFTSSETNRATSISQGTSFKRNGVSTMLTLIENMLTREIVKKYFNDKLSFRFTREIDLTDEAIRADIDQKNVSTGIVTVNELRLRDGREEIEEPDIDPDTGRRYEDNIYESDESEHQSDEGETPEEKTEKSINVDGLENNAAKNLEWWGDKQEHIVLAELEALYGQ